MDNNSLSDKSERPTALNIRNKLIEYVAASLRQLPESDRTLVHLPRVLVPTEWDGWMDEVEPGGRDGRAQFNFLYQFCPAGQWNPSAVKDRFGALLTDWGWQCADEGFVPSDSAGLNATSPDGYQLILQANLRRDASSLHLISPAFDQSADAPAVTMPFAVTPFGPLSLATLWAIHPEFFSENG